MDTKLQSHGDAFSDTIAQVPSCTLDAQGLERQRERHRRVAQAVVQMRRASQLLTIDFAADFDRQSLEELIAVERECCPFFAFRFNEHLRRLDVSVHDADDAPALDAIATALSAGQAQT